MNDIDYVLIKSRTPNFMEKNMNNNKNKKNDINKPHTPEIKNLSIKYNKELENNFNNKNIKRPSTAQHNNIHMKIKK